jgi:hypothetical protein
MEQYSGLKWKKILAHATTRINLEDLTLSEISQPQKAKYLHAVTRVGNPRVTEVEWWLPGTGERRDGYRVLVLQEERV